MAEIDFRAEAMKCLQEAQGCRGMRRRAMLVAMAQSWLEMAEPSTPSTAVGLT